MHARQEEVRTALRLVLSSHLSRVLGPDLQLSGLCNRCSLPTDILLGLKDTIFNFIFLLGVWCLVIAPSMCKVPGLTSNTNTCIDSF